jgi:hypothetical protein
VSVVSTPVKAPFVNLVIDETNQSRRLAPPRRAFELSPARLNAGISTPTGFYNKAWGRRDNGAPQENLPCDLNLNGVPQFVVAIPD